MTPLAIPLIYIAGPFRGATPLDVRRNVEAARDLGLHVARLGGYPMIPHTMTAEFDKQLTDEFWLAGTMAMLSKCDAIVMHVQWQRSTGAMLEHADAVNRDLPVFYTDYDGWSETVQRWIEAWVSNRTVSA